MCKNIDAAPLVQNTGFTSRVNIYPVCFWKDDVYLDCFEAAIKCLAF